MGPEFKKILRFKVFKDINTDVPISSLKVLLSNQDPNLVKVDLLGLKIQPSLKFH